MPLFGIKKKEQLSEAKEFQEDMKEAIKGLMKVVTSNDMSDNDAPDRFAEELVKNPKLFQRLNKPSFIKELEPYHEEKEVQYFKERREGKTQEQVIHIRNEMYLASNLEVVLGCIDAYPKLAILFCYVRIRF